MWLLALQASVAQNAAAAFSKIADGSPPANEPGCSNEAGRLGDGKNSQALDACAQFCLDTAGCRYFQSHLSGWCIPFSTCALNRRACAFPFSWSTCQERMGFSPRADAISAPLRRDTPIGC